VLVPNQFPSVDPTTHRLAVIGEAPGEDEATVGKPFVGTSGRFLRAILAGAGASVNQTFLGNICQVQPPGNDISKFEFDGPEIQDGLGKLTEDLRQFQPNCILVAGRTAFRGFRPDLCYQSKRSFVVPLTDWRGSIYKGPTPLGDFKFVPTYHPAYILRTYSDAPFFTFDVARAVKHSAFPELTTLTRVGILRPTIEQVCEYCLRARREGTPQTFDIEGYPDSLGVTMLSLVPTADPTTGIVIPFQITGDGGRYWSEDEEVIAWDAVSGLLADPLVPKTLHNAFYDLFVLAWRHKIVVNNVQDDTMMAHWELYPDFAKADKEEKKSFSMTQKKRSLGVCCSMYTEQPYYKDDRLSQDPETKLNYSFLDSSVTAEVRNSAVARLQRVPGSYTHYRFNINLIPAYNYIMLRGCKFDVGKAKQLATEVEGEISILNHQINTALDERGAFGSFPVPKGKEKHRQTEGFNVKSTTQKQWLLYEHLKHKPLQKFKTDSGGDGTSEDALLHFWKKDPDPLLRLVIRAVRKRTRLSDIHKLTTDPDGRIRTAYDLVGTNTGRLSSRSSMSMVLSEDGWENTGTNLQNVTKELRVCFIPDAEEYDFWQFDLSGADGWTVAAELAAIGHPTMLDDYLYGIKPALVLQLMLNEHAAGRDPRAVSLLARDTLKAQTKALKKWIDENELKTDSEGRPVVWQYLCCKRVQHGSNYDMQAERTAELVFGDSDGTVVLNKKDAEFYQSLYKLRYKTDVRNDWIRKTLQASACITTSGGVRKQFFGIRNRGDIDDEIVRQASSFNPQFNTTYATNSALAKMWYDGENRTSKGSLFVEPLIQIHDAFAGQNHQRVRDWAAGKFREWFNNPIRIAGIEVNIPVDGHYGTNWKDCKTHIET
jgi:uracil-DNA glycosylase family 4